MSGVGLKSESAPESENWTEGEWLGIDEFERSENSESEGSTKVRVERDYW